MARGVGSQRVTAPPPSTSTLHSPPSTPRTPALSKNLRWTAVALVSKMSRERERLSAAVADEVAAAASSDMRARFPLRDSAAVERNTRRRVYDALKVMVSVGCIEREGKSLRWIGVDDLRHRAIKSTSSATSSVTNHDQNDLYESPTKLRVAICEARRRILRKKELLRDLQRRVDAFETLGKRRRAQQPPRQRSSKTKPSSDSRQKKDPQIRFPFVVISGANPDVRYTSDHKRMRVSTSSPFRLYSETDVVSMLADRRRTRSVPAAPRKPRLPKKGRQSPLTPASNDTLLSAPPLDADLDLSDDVDLGESIAALPKLEPEGEPLDIVVRSNPSSFENEEPGGDPLNECRPAKTECTSPSESLLKATTTEDSSKERKDKLQLPKHVQISGLHAEKTEQDTNNSSCTGVDSAATESEYLGCEGPLKESLSDDNAPIICHEELGIPPLAEGNSADLCSEEEAFLSLKTDSSGNVIRSSFPC